VGRAGTDAKRWSASLTTSFWSRPTAPTTEETFYVGNGGTAMIVNADESCDIVRGARMVAVPATVARYVQHGKNTPRRLRVANAEM
jgi:hypothetical protein